MPAVTGRAWIVVPQARRPVTKSPAATVAALEAVQAAPPAVARTLITRADGMIGVSVFDARSFFTESEFNAFGVTLHEQHDTSYSSGEYA